MTPYEIGILLHYYAMVEDHPDLNRRPPIWQPTIERFLEQRLIQAGTICTYGLTDRGQAYVDALRLVPLPESCWIVKWPKPATVDADV